MSREVRRVPSNWQHPKNNNGRYRPILDGYKSALNDWKVGYAKWERDELGDFDKKLKASGREYWDYAGNPPSRDEYMPDWPESERTHWQMYETTSEGTPISSPMSSPDELAQWLADTGASAFGGMTATKEQWLSMIGVGSSLCGMVMDKNGTMKSGVEVVAETNGGRK